MSGKGCDVNTGDLSGQKGVHAAKRPKSRPAGVRAAIVAKKSGNADGAKGGRKWDGKQAANPPESAHRLPLWLEHARRKCLGKPKKSTYAREEHICHGLSLKCVETRGAFVPWTPARVERVNPRLESRMRESRTSGSEGGVAQ